MSVIIDNYHNAQQDILESFIDRGELRTLAEPTTLPNGKRIPGLKLDHPRQLAVMHALVRFANIAAGTSFTTAELYGPALDALGRTQSEYSLASFRYDLSKLRAKGSSKNYRTPVATNWSARATPSAWYSSNCSKKVYAPLTAGLLARFRGDRILA